MKINKTKFKDLIFINNNCFKDNRGYFKELIREKKLKIKFPFIVMSYSKKKNVLEDYTCKKRNPKENL